MGKLEPQEPCARMGWISPEGEFFPCAYTAHRDLAFLLSAEYYDSNWGEMLLMGNQWIALRENATIDISKTKTTFQSIYTDRQQDIIRLILDAFELAETNNPDIDWDIELCKNPEHYDTIKALTKPCKRLTEGITYAQTFRDNYEFLFNTGEWREQHIPKLTIPPSLRYKYAEHPGD